MDSNSWNTPARRAWNTPWNIRKSEHARRKPDGGFCFIPAMALMRAWWAYRGKIIRLQDLRVWFACFEVVARRCDVAPDRFPRYTREEIHRLVGGRDAANVQTAIRRLSNAGLLDWSERSIRVPPHGWDVERDSDPKWQRMVELVVNHRRKVPVPRRTLRFLASMSRPVSIATVLGHLLRCLYYRNGLCVPDGRCKASWVAETFGVDVRNVKAARLYLGEIEWLVVENSSQTALNRWGAAVRVNLAWNDKRGRGENGSPPPLGRKAVGSPLPRRNRKLSSRMKDQKPQTDPGACMQARKPILRDVCIEDLKIPARLEVLFEEARRRGLTRDGEAARLCFHSAAAHALRVGRRNPPGLFVSIVRRGLWSFISAVDEEVARKLTRPNGLPGVSRISRLPARVGVNQNFSPDSVRRIASHVLRQIRLSRNNTSRSCEDESFIA